MDDYANALQELAKKAGVPVDEEKDISHLNFGVFSHTLYSNYFLLFSSNINL